VLPWDELFEFENERSKMDSYESPQMHASDIGRGDSASVTLLSMCGRYRLTAAERYIAQHFDIDEDEVHWTPRYNIAPTQNVGVVRQTNRSGRTFKAMRWGLIPYWAKDASIANHTINAMSESAADKPAFREALQRRRCLIPADGFYEWKKLSPRQKQPYGLSMVDDSLFAFAGLWDKWRSPHGDVFQTCTILTTSANSLLRDIHHRMPVILRREDFDLWLDPAITDSSRVAQLMKPFDELLMKATPVSTTLNNAQNDSAECMQPVDAVGEGFTPTLF